VPGVFASAVIGQHLGHPAFANLPMPAAFNHEFKLGLQCREVADALVDVGEARLSDGIGGSTGLAGIVLLRPLPAGSLSVETVRPESS
jgi:hypothetical protein